MRSRGTVEESRKDKPCEWSAKGDARQACGCLTTMGGDPSDWQFGRRFGVDQHAKLVNSIIVSEYNQIGASRIEDDSYNYPLPW